VKNFLVDKVVPQRDMKIVKRLIPGAIGLIFGSTLMLIVNFINYKSNFDAMCMDCDNDFGWPFRIYQSGSTISATKILWQNVFFTLVLFGLAGVGLALLVRWILKRLIK
jgi:hypothetical protein